MHLLQQTRFYDVMLKLSNASCDSTLMQLLLGDTNDAGSSLQQFLSEKDKLLIDCMLL